MSYLQWKRLCKTCGVRYAEIDNIGVHACKYHSGPFNKDGPGRWHPEGCWECCGKSPYATLINGRRNPNFSAKFLHGCTRMDHSALQTVFSKNDDIPEEAWPRELCHELSKDILKLKKGEVDIKHRGLKMNEAYKFFIERFDREQYELRRKHKFIGDEQMTKEIHYQYENKNSVIIIEKDKTVADLLREIKKRNKVVGELTLGSGDNEDKKIENLSNDEWFIIKQLT